MISLHLRIRVAADRREAFLEFLREAIPFYESPGGIRVRLLRDRADPERYIEVVEYESAEAFDRDEQRIAHDPEMRAYLDRWRAIIAGPPEVEVYQLDAVG